MKLINIQRKYLIIILIFLLINLFNIKIKAYDEIYVDKNMSLKIVNYVEDEPISGGEFQIYRVAKICEDSSYELEDSFKESHVSLDKNILEENLSDIAVTLKAYIIQNIAENNVISPISSDITSKEGVITFKNLYPGLYLLVGQQSIINQNIYTPLATLISISYEDQEDNNYEKIINVKNSIKPISNMVTDLSVIKIWKDEGYEEKRPSEIEVTLYRNSTEYSTVKLGVENNWRYTWKELESDSEWSLVEKDISSNYSVTSVQDGENFIVTNTYNEEVSNLVVETTTPNKQDKLPQTGQSWWPIYIFSMIGLVLFIIDLIIIRNDNHYKKKIVKKLSKIFISISIFLFLISIILLFYNLLDNHRAKVCSDSILKEWDNFIDKTYEDKPIYITNPDVEMPTIEINGNSYIGKINIESLNLSLPIMSEWSYPNLKLSPCRYSGSVYTNNLIIAGHNYNNHFGKLKNLNFEDLVSFTDVDGNIFEYKVIDIEQISENDVEKVKNGTWDLTLFTCTLGGDCRVVVRCKLL